MLAPKKVAYDPSRYLNIETVDEAIEIILEGKGSHFDPDMIDAFALITDEFRDIATRYAD